jgi:beta-galactosidase/beta-glucuronidase
MSADNSVSITNQFVGQSTLRDVPRPEYPRPQFVRANWLCLNGLWQFEIDSGDSGLARGLRERDLAQQIVVPFCPESSLSGIGNTDFMHCVWYRREVEIPADWNGRDILLHFQAVDYDSTVWVAHADRAHDKDAWTEVGRHRGGFSPFTCDLRGVVQPGQRIVICLRARDENRISQPRGKQSSQYASHDCFYTRTTGIWQSVWLEPVPRVHLKRPRLTPDVANSTIRLEQPLSNNRRGYRLRARLKNGTKVLCETMCRADLDLAPRLDLRISDPDVRLWSTNDPFLYDVEIELLDADGEIVDAARSYAGLRSVSIDGKAVKINGEVVFQRLVLDQGYYPDGVMTAPSDEALKRDILLSMEVGFNGARLHQKVFEERFIYHADKLGYLLWGEFADWGCSGHGPWHDHQQPGVTYTAQWLEVLERDYSHPSIIGWCALNETAQTMHDRITVLDDATRALFLAAKAMDTSRPVLDTSGYSHRVPESDIYDSHDYIYEADFALGLERFTQRHSGLPEDEAFSNPYNYDPATGAAKTQVSWSVPYRGQPYFVSEIGGFKWNPNTETRSAEANLKERKTSWGYGSDPASVEEFYARFAAICDVMIDNPYLFGYCYTQLTDIFPEENGIFSFDRTAKFDIARLRDIQTRTAAIEKEHSR